MDINELSFRQNSQKCTALVNIQLMVKSVGNRLGRMLLTHQCIREL